MDNKQSAIILTGVEYDSDGFCNISGPFSADYAVTLYDHPELSDYLLPATTQFLSHDRPVSPRGL